jgi:UTP-glucose-1-phosphate uridylyltransferase/mevalonate kinase
MRSIEIFVPGRICLFGEHTDWAGGYRRTNEALEKGYTIITGTNQGIHARVSPHPSSLVVRSTLDDGSTQGPLELPMEPAALLQEARKGGFFSYAAGVAFQVLTHYRVRGLEIDNYRTDLPVRKGLSSSAALCVLVARAFNRIYDLKLTRRGEMEYAYLGETTTPSRCGRMDQGCAYGSRPVMMTFDGDRLDVDELKVGGELHLIIVDLKAGKDTRRILADLNRGYPFARDEVGHGIQDFLGPISARITHEAAEALAEGDAARLGRLMTEAQAEFDAHLQPACSSELTAPVLHKLLSYAPIQPLILGGKGVGSGGDGTGQLLAKDVESRREAIGIIERDLGMGCLELTIGAERGVRKAVIPAAGFGARLFPATKAIKKELFPIVDAEGRAKPVILAVVEEALNAGVEEVAIVIQERDRQAFEDLFYSAPPLAHYHRLSQADQRYSGYLVELGHHVRLIVQEAQEGFGHAVHCAREFVGDEPFLLMLGDHLYRSSNDVSCARQLVEEYARTGQSVVGLKPVREADLYRFGCVAGDWTGDSTRMNVTELAEKPTLDYARQHLRVAGLGGDEYLSLLGLYVLTPHVFDLLAERIEHNLREGGEFQLTPALDRLRQEEGMSGYVVQGERYDVGMPDSYREALARFGRAAGEG